MVVVWVVMMRRRRFRRLRRAPVFHGVLVDVAVAVLHGHLARAVIPVDALRS